MKANTAAALAEIERAAGAGQTMIAPVIFSTLYGRAACSAAFRIARQRKVVEIAYVSAAGTPVYRAYGVGAALQEIGSATKH
ncbi:MAG: hypothetical protein KJZ75_08230 [Hyphomonadaceae bacterium]|nr:hypothetical protein [Hyphomonadaceae bacterium]